MALIEADRDAFGEGASPLLRTARLVLRAPRPSDAKAIALLANDRRISAMTRRIPFPYTQAHAEQFIELVLSGKGREIALLLEFGGDVIGACGLGRAEEQIPEIGYWLGAPFWGQGFATEAARAIVDYAFTHQGCQELQAGARVSNPASRRVLEKCGFQWTGVALYRIAALGSSAPIDRFRLDQGLWRSLKSWNSAPRDVV